MKANKLRIENLVLYNGIVMKISEICSPKPLKDKKYSDKYIIELFDGAGLINCVIDEIEPIPLTLQFYREIEIQLIRKGFSYGFENGKLTLYLSEERQFESEFLHQLQNLYFALTQEELKIK